MGLTLETITQKTITVDSNGCAIVDDILKKLLPKVWGAIKLNYYDYSYKTYHLKATIIQRWWRKASGFYNGFELVKIESYLFDFPLLWKNQIAKKCEPNFYNYCVRELHIINGWVCPNTPRRFNKRSFEPAMTDEGIYKIIEDDVHYSNQFLFDNLLYRNPYKKICCCTDTKASDYIEAFQNDRRYLQTIFYLLSRDKINVKTRIKLSRFLQSRLS